MIVTATSTMANQLLVTRWEYDETRRDASSRAATGGDRKLSRQSQSSIRMGLCAIAFSAASSVGAVPIVDQSQTSNSLSLAAPTGSAQSFVQSNGNIAGAGVYVYYQSVPGELTIELWTTAPVPGGDGAVRTRRSETISGNGYVDVLWAPFDSAAEETYYLVFRSADNLVLGGGSNTPYTLGEAYLDFKPQGGGFDFAFRTYFDDGVRPVPEPGTFVLLGMAMAGVLFTRHRTRS